MKRTALALGSLLALGVAAAQTTASYGDAYSPTLELQQWISALPRVIEFEGLDLSEARQLYSVLSSLKSTNGSLTADQAQQMLSAIAATLPAPLLQQLEDTTSQLSVVVRGEDVLRDSEVQSALRAVEDVISVYVPEASD